MISIKYGRKGAMCVKMGPQKKKKSRAKKNSSGAQDRTRDADDIAPADGPRLATRDAFLLVHPDVSPERPGVAVRACDVDVNAGRGLRCEEGRGHLWGGCCEGAKRCGGGAEEAGGEAAAAEGGEDAEGEDVYF